MSCDERPTWKKNNKIKIKQEIIHSIVIFSKDLILWESQTGKSKPVVTKKNEDTSIDSNFNYILIITKYIHK